MAIWYAYDVDGGEKRSVFFPFFEIPTASLTAVTRIVNMSGAAIVLSAFIVVMIAGDMISNYYLP